MGRSFTYTYVLEWDYEGEPELAAWKTMGWMGKPSVMHGFACGKPSARRLARWVEAENERRAARGESKVRTARIMRQTPYYVPTGIEYNGGVYSTGASVTEHRGRVLFQGA